MPTLLTGLKKRWEDGREWTEWRCTNPDCFVKPLFFIIGEDMGYLKVNGRRSFNLHYVFDYGDGVVRAHCPSCHEWRQLEHEREGWYDQPADRDAKFPRIACTCTASG